jgi:hypothetical protein
MRSLILMCMLIPTLATAAPCKDGKSQTSTHKHYVSTVEREPASSNEYSYADGFQLRAGVLFDNVDNTLCHPSNDNPFYLGLGYSLPLSKQFGLYAGATHRFASEAKHDAVNQANVELTFAPFKGGK